MAKNKKVLKSLAVAALATSAIVPVASANTATTYSDIVTSVNGQLTSITSAEYTLATALGKTPSVDYIKVGDKFYAKADYDLQVALHGASAFQKLVESGTPANITPVVGKVDGSGNITTETAPAGELKVESVSAINASELVVTFGSNVDSTTGTDKANYQIKVDDSTLSPGQIASIVVKDNKAIIRLATGSTLANGNKYVIQTRDAIKASNGSKFEKFTSVEKTFSETAAPVLKEVTTSVGSSTLTLEFDRPVDNTTSLIKVDGQALTSKALTQSPSTAGNYKYTVTLDAGLVSTLAASGTHEIVIYDVKDTALAYPKVASVVSKTYTISQTVVVPEVVGIEAVTANRFFVETNTAITLDGAKLTVNKGTHEFGSVDSNNFTSNTLASLALDATDSKFDAYPGTRGTKKGFWVIITDDKNSPTDQNPLYKGSEQSAQISVTVENFKSATGNLVGAKATKSVTLQRNATKPTIKEAKVASSTTIDVTFNGILAAQPSDIVLRDKNGIIKTASVTGMTTNTDNQSVVTVTLGSGTTTDAPYTVEFVADKFAYANQESTVSGYLVNSTKNEKLVVTAESTATNFKYQELALTDVAGGALGTAAGNVKVTSTNNQNTIDIVYGQNMTDSARNVANYKLDGKALPAGSTVDFVTDKKQVRITLPTGTLSTATQYKLEISSDVTTETGSKIVKSAQTLANTDVVLNLADTVAPQLKSATYLVAVEDVKATTTTTEIELTFNEKLASLAGADGPALANDFKVVINGSEVGVASVADGTAGDEKVTLTLSQPVNVNQVATISIVPELEQTVTANSNKTILVTDAAGNKASTAVTATASATKYSTAYASSVKLAAILAADTKLALLAYSVTNSIDTAAKLATAKTQYTEAKTAVDAAIATGLVVTGDLNVTNYPKLALQNTEILRFEAVAADIAGAVSALATPTVDVSGANLGTLPLTGTNGTTIAWTSAATGKLSNAGVYGSGGAAAGEVVVLTATISKANGESKTVKFDVAINDTKITGITKQ